MYAGWSLDHELFNRRGLLPLTMSYISTAAGEREDQTTLPIHAGLCGGSATSFCTLGVTAVELGGVWELPGSNERHSRRYQTVRPAGLQLLGFRAPFVGRALPP
jgi:cytochrome c-type biogenesis protein